MVRHQAVAQQYDAASMTFFGKKRQVFGTIMVEQENVLAVVASLGNVMRRTDRHHPSLAGHEYVATDCATEPAFRKRGRTLLNSIFMRKNVWNPGSTADDKRGPSPFLPFLGARRGAPLPLAARGTSRPARCRAQKPTRARSSSARPFHRAAKRRSPIRRTTPGKTGRQPVSHC